MTTTLAFSVKMATFVKLCRKYLKTLIVCAGVFYVGITLHFDVVLYLLKAGSVIGLLIRVIIFWPLKNYSRLLAQGLLLIFTFLAIETTFNYQANKRRIIANTIAEKIMVYKANYGNFPKDLAILGEDVNSASYRVKYAYTTNNHEPLLYYADTNPTLANEYIYNFNTKTWIDSSEW